MSAEVADTPSLTSGRYRLDPQRTTISLHTRHMWGLGKVSARFALREGEIVIADPPGSSTGFAVVDATSFTSGIAMRDNHVRQPKFLDTDRHPDIRVDVTSVEQSVGQQGTPWIAVGTLTARGNPAALRITVDRAEPDGANIRVWATARVDRYAHGMTRSKGLAGRWMSMTIEATARPL